MFYVTEWKLVTELQERTAVYVIGDSVDVAEKYAVDGSNRSREGNRQNKNYEYIFSYFIGVKYKQYGCYR
jgi:hypothetical protein